MTGLLFVSGSLRAASSATALARTLIEGLEGKARAELAEIGHLPHYNADLDTPPEVEDWKRRIDAADGVVLVTPEYNYSVPGVLKNAIDWASRPAYASVFRGKPCLVVSVSGGALGGVRAQGHLKYILGAMLADVHKCQEIVVPFAPKKVVEGRIRDEAVLAFALEQLDGFIRHCEARRETPAAD